jgi:hypothetical protein
MMRMGLVVVGLSTLAIMELETPPPTKTIAADPLHQLTVDVNVSSDTLETADRMEIHHLQEETPLQPASPVEPTLPPDVTTTTLVPGDSSTVGLGANDRKDIVRKPKSKPQHTDDPNIPRPERTKSNKAAKTERSNAGVEVRPCRSKALGSLLQVLNLSTRCQT